MAWVVERFGKYDKTLEPGALPPFHLTPTTHLTLTLTTTATTTTTNPARLPPPLPSPLLYHYPRSPPV
jgi:regulator of protease activity HflC (stomatin/prohibitin superfamily)